MTTATPTPAAPTTLVEVWTAERDGLKAQLDAVEAALEQLKKDQEAAQAARDAGAAAVAEQDQAISNLRQKLSAAALGDIHSFELELAAAGVLRLRALRRQVDGSDRFASIQATITRTLTTQGRVEAEHTTAEAALTKAVADAAKVDAATKDLDATVARVVADAGALAPDIVAAQARLDRLLGSAAMRTALEERLRTVAQHDTDRRHNRDTSEAARRAADVERSPVDGHVAAAAAAHTAALDAILNAAGTPQRLAEAKKAVETVTALPDLRATTQAAIDAAANGTDDTTVIPLPPGSDPVTQLENWAIKIPPDLLAATLAFVDARSAIDDLRTLDAVALRAALTTAQADLVAAQTARIATAKKQTDAAEAAQAAADAVTADEATSAHRRTLAVIGN